MNIESGDVYDMREDRAQAVADRLEEAERLLQEVMTCWRTIPADIGLRIGAFLDK